MSKALFNPKYLTVTDKDKNSRRVLNTADVINFVWSHARWNLKVGEIKKFPDDVADSMLRQISFLKEVTAKNIEAIRKERSEATFKCPDCEYETDTKVAYIQHSKNHGNTPENDKLLEGIEEAQPTGRFKSGAINRQNPEQLEGIPKGEGEDRDGVAWYGDGWTGDNPNS